MGVVLLAFSVMLFYNIFIQLRSFPMERNGAKIKIESPEGIRKQSVLSSGTIVILALSEYPPDM